MIISRTPVRLSFLGGTSDYPQWWRSNGGLVVGAALDKYVYVSAAHLPPYHDYKNRFVYSEIETVSDVCDVKHRAIRATLEHLSWGHDGEAGVELFHTADLPSCSGTGSSSSFVVGMLNALAGLRRQRLCPADLAHAATVVEQVRMGDNVGNQDQVFAAHGGLNVVRFHPHGTIDVTPLIVGPDDLLALESHVLLFWTGIKRRASDVAAVYVPHLRGKPDVVLALVKYAEEGVNALYKNDYEALGRLVDLSWRAKATLSPTVAPESVQAMYAEARLSGAFGGKLMGAGGGGCLFLLAPPEKRARLIAAMAARGATHVPCRFDFSGSSVIFSSR